MRTLILGMGNPIISDDSVGIRVAERLEERLRGREDVTVISTSTSGLTLVDLISGYDRVVVVDSIQTQGGKPGTIYRLSPDSFDQAQHAATLHGVGLLGALALGKSLELDMPGEVVLFAIEAQDIVTFGEQCTPEVEAAIPLAEDMVWREAVCGPAGP